MKTGITAAAGYYIVELGLIPKTVAVILFILL